jgi:hypothetical protein
MGQGVQKDSLLARHAERRVVFDLDVLKGVDAVAKDL